MTRNKILIIEDNLLNLELATDLLEANGFVVWSARTAEEGLRLAREFMPDLVLMDFSLPGMDGLAATRILKNNPLMLSATMVEIPRPTTCFAAGRLDPTPKFDPPTITSPFCTSDDQPGRFAEKTNLGCSLGGYS